MANLRRDVCAYDRNDAACICIFYAELGYAGAEGSSEYYIVSALRNIVIGGDAGFVSWSRWATCGSVLFFSWANARFSSHFRFRGANDLFKKCFYIRQGP